MLQNEYQPPIQFLVKMKNNSIICQKSVGEDTQKQNTKYRRVISAEEWLAIYLK
jgi:hypothetical protein